MTISLVATEEESNGIKFKNLHDEQLVQGTTLVKRGFAHMQNMVLLWMLLL